MKMKNRRYFYILITALIMVPAAVSAQNVGGVNMPIPKIAFNITEATGAKDVALSLQILFLLSILTLAPSIIIMMTAFTRVVIVLDFVKRALSLQQMPPNQVIVGLSLFLTFFIMAPTLTEMNDKALQPYLNGQISNQQFFDRGMAPMRDFMFRQTREKDIALFVKLSKIEKPKSRKDIPSYCLIPAFMISELRIAFEIGVFLFLPFIVIDMIIASALMAMGMIMLPPVMISLPFKLILFILVDGWNLLVYELVRSFR
ncbi:MAG TPA: flagellar type III secretion system pore protein FliP [Spirochaetota bacterium]|nr:flagellar type III secretion system pore protein FliP [Spirochaetota bacterium]HPF06025.1 flagellar type III secretion system pore protein FliP [Spirochaetota bacterium]HPJ41825.1 flagellar type III secretion system pore protein FliP [Spirochaetota bacterium]HPR36792.1 flagellar type III secretion system pore protein FliP [Spirochaetota bacterium]HRX46331.1 flagellar type III secretion system pore protein FliP [Spirochaetota bacterium]